jgi:hypothetical protein
MNAGTRFTVNPHFFQVKQVDQVVSLRLHVYGFWINPDYFISTYVKVW